MTLSFPPPKNWDDFESLTSQVARYKLAGEFDRYGRQGQKQSGVDIYGYDYEDVLTGIQCKHKGNAKSRSGKVVTDLTDKMIDGEVRLADNFNPALKVFIIATTSFRDIAIQDHINGINEARRGGSLPKVGLWTWETFEEEINRHSILQYIYYDKVLRSFSQYNKDLHILSLLRHAVDRPAFTTPFHVENNCADFLNAIVDTQTAFTTGKLNDRMGRPIASSYMPKNLSNSDDRVRVEQVKKLLQEIRDFVTLQMRDGNIIQKDSWLEFRHNPKIQISEFLNKKRADIIDLLNISLTDNNLEPVESALVKGM